MAAPPPPIPLPPQINQPVFIPRPVAPANPPTAADYVNAVEYVKRVDVAKLTGGVTAIQQQQAYRYLSLIDAAMNLPAALHLPTVQAGLQGALQAALQAALPAALQAALPAALQGALAELYIMAAQNHNRQVIDGNSIPFREVRFPNGDRPTQAPHVLPLLDSVTAIDQLTAAEMATYIANYTPAAPVPNQRHARIRMIKLAIGCPL